MASWLIFCRDGGIWASTKDDQRFWSTSWRKNLKIHIYYKQLIWRFLLQNRVLKKKYPWALLMMKILKWKIIEDILMVCWYYLTFWRPKPRPRNWNDSCLTKIPSMTVNEWNKIWWILINFDRPAGTNMRENERTKPFRQMMACP